MLEKKEGKRRNYGRILIKNRIVKNVHLSMSNSPLFRRDFGAIYTLNITY